MRHFLQKATMKIMMKAPVLMRKQRKKEKFLSSINYTPVTNSGSFKVNNKWLFLTYSNVHTKYTKYEEIEYENPQKEDFRKYTDEKQLRKEFEKACRTACKPKNAKNEITQFLCGLEYHKNGIPHFHVAVSYATAHQCADAKKFDVKMSGKTFHPNIIRVKTQKDFLNVVQYISKEDKVLQKRGSK